MISDKHGLEHPEEKIRQVITRLESLLSKASDPAQRAALERAVEAKRALLATAAADSPALAVGARDSPRSGADTQGRPRAAPSPCGGTGQVSRLWEEPPVEMTMPAQGIRLVLDAEVALESPAPRRGQAGPPPHRAARGAGVAAAGQV